MNIDQQLALLQRSTASIVPANGLRAKLERSLACRKPLRIKLGLDPTAPDIHLGFAVVLRKLRQFQDLGHEVVIIIGDYTALIGDPSGRSATRPMLSEEAIRANAETYVDQLALILDRSRTTVRFNSEWLGKLSFAEIVSLSSRMTVAQVLERDDFQKRLAAHQPVSLHELLYPLAQAYDSVAIEADIEMGGQDQTFNILAGRDLQRELGQEPQVALFMPLLVGLDGEKKMSKSLGNYVGITESPAEMHGKLLSMPDEAMAAYFDLCTTMEKPEYETLLNEAVEGRRNPKEIKRRLAREIVSAYHGQDAAAKADEEFERIHARHEDPGEVEEVALPAEAVKDGKVWLCRLIVATGLAASTGEARRLVEQGGFRLNGHRLADPKADLPIESVDGALLQAGNRRFRRVRV